MSSKKLVHAAWRPLKPEEGLNSPVIYVEPTHGTKTWWERWTTPMPELQTTRGKVKFAVYYLVGYIAIKWLIS